MICVILSISVFLYNSNRCHLCSPLKFWFVISDRSVLRLGKNLSVRSIVFSIWVCIVETSPSIWPNGRIVAISGFRKLLNLAHLLIFHIVFDWMVTLAISNLQHIVCIVYNTAFCHLYTVWIRFHMFYDDVL